MTGAQEIWVVEDDDAMRHALVRVLRDHGLSSRGFADPRELLRAAKLTPPAAVLTEHKMPHITGEELAIALRAQLAGRAPRVVLLTGARIPRAAQRHYDRVMPKPFVASHLIDALRVLLRDRSSHTRLRIAPAGGAKPEGGAKPWTKS
ncbi:MAG: response regulator [Sandaracinaceae bacterium]|nr:response regulator [Sandaracinaceae bacterium]